MRNKSTIFIETPKIGTHTVERKCHPCKNSVALPIDVSVMKTVYEKFAHTPRYDDSTRAKTKCPHKNAVMQSNLLK